MLDLIPEKSPWLANKNRWKFRRPNPDDEPRYDRFNLTIICGKKSEREIQKRMLEQAVYFATQDNLDGRTVDRPLDGVVAVMPRDERESRNGKPLAAADYRGRVPAVYVTGGSMHWQDIKDKFDERLHYGEDIIERDDRPDINADWKDALDRQIRDAAGHKTYGGSQTKGKYRG